MFHATYQLTIDRFSLKLENTPDHKDYLLYDFQIGLELINVTNTLGGDIDIYIIDFLKSIKSSNLFVKSHDSFTAEDTQILYATVLRPHDQPSLELRGFFQDDFITKLIGLTGFSVGPKKLYSDLQIGISTQTCRDISTQIDNNAESVDFKVGNYKFEFRMM